MHNRIRAYMGAPGPADGESETTTSGGLHPKLIAYLQSLNPERARVERRFAHQLLHIIRQNPALFAQREATVAAIEARLDILNALRRRA